MTGLHAAIERLHGRARDDRGAIAIMTGILAVVLLVIAGLSVDVGNAWAVRGMLQTQADLAAVTAAQDALPVKLTGTNAAATQTAVAMDVAYTFACNPVRGQQTFDPSVPLDVNYGGTINCAGGDRSQTALSTYAAKMLSTGMITFPTTTSVTVTSPASRVDFGFGPAQNGKSVAEQKSSTAQIYSPGAAAPIALGLQCTLSAAGTAPAGLGDLATGSIPLNYIAAGPLGSNSTTEPALAVTTSSMPAGNANAVLTSMGSGPTYQGQAAIVPVATFTAPVTGAVAGVARLHFYRGTENYTSNPFAYATGLTVPATVAIPAGVTNTAGTWLVQLEYKPTTIPATTTFTTTSLASYKTYTVLPPAGTQSLTACANLTDSPRRDTSNTVITGETMRRNIKTGMDHSLTAHDALVTLNPPASLSAGNVINELNNSPSITDCVSGTTPTPGSVLDTDATKISPLANCVNIATDGARQDEFTQGFLADPNGSFRGRLNCSVTACTHGSPFAITGLPGTYNDDRLSDFQNTGSVLNSALFFGLSTYLTDDLPVVTPPSTALKSDLYSSPRFMWAAVASRAVGPTACTKCPVLTFRPIFLTQDAPSGITGLDELTTQLSDITGSLFSSILGTLFPYLAPAATSTDHGLIMDGTKLRALRFQTIEPTALPVPPLNYNGPVSDYLGTGPKVVRLVK